MIALMMQLNATQPIYFMGRDQLGPMTIRDDSDNVIERLAYEPFYNVFRGGTT
ncbi:hypothetical protein [Herbaspirillum rubrisubalbicans]|uniref:hypothetical protein n=1 Tax=Herbaspirillum rubrisubalbicans TaxID=80842 RepID=UPI0002DFAE36|nr:hypothetical protein [Herbaspirillum rubrisubalbicans]